MDLHVFPIVTPHPSGASQCTSSEHFSHASILVICFTLSNIYVSMLFSQINPPSPSPMESKSLFYTYVSLFCLPHMVIISIFLNSTYMH